jgi:hypothetical protein
MITGAGLSKTAKEVLDEMEDKSQGFDSAKQVYEMELINSKGKVENTKEMEVYVLVMDESEQTDSFTMMRIVKPKNLSGTTVMTLEEDEQYIYMPSYRKVKKITGSSKNDNFLDTDLKYSELALVSGDVEQENEAQMLEETDEAYVIRIDIDDSDLDYAYMIMAVERESLNMKKIEFYDEANKLLKTMEAADYREIGGYTVFGELVVTDIEANHSTKMNLVEAEFDIPITKKFFSTLNMTSRVLRYR